MSSRAQLLDCYQRWGQLSRLEHRALLNSDWPSLAVAQREKTDLQATIERCTAELLCSGSRAQTVPERDELDAVVRELVQSETEMMELLRQLREKARSQAEELNRARANLKRLHGSYSTGPRSVWSSYS
jgi:hypothetical protein